jgi:hypothetical protein
MILAAAYLIIVFSPRDSYQSLTSQAIPFASYQECEASMYDNHQVFGMTVQAYCIHGSGEKK